LMSITTAARTGSLRIAILLVEMPRMLRDVVANIVGVEPDLCVVADGVEAGTLVDRVEREQPDVVVLSDESGSPPAICEELLGRFPQLSVVAIESHAQRASIYMMRPMRLRLAEISSTQLVNAIRRAAGPVPFPARVYAARAKAAGAAAAQLGSEGLTPDPAMEFLRQQKRRGTAS
jgi:DNA-binding NarL/FixJ family response regulator